MPDSTAQTPQHAREGIETARFTKVGENESIAVFFNPESLQYDIANQLKPEGNNSTVQYVSQSSAKLSMELLWDSTHSGQDVREETQKVMAMMAPVDPAKGDKKKKVPAKVRFEWGSISFEGYIESYKEVLDFFSKNGVPLRSRVNLVLTKQDSVFEKDAAQGTISSKVDGAVTFEAGSGRELTQTLNTLKAAQPSTGKGPLEENGVENPRFPGSGPLVLGGGGGAGISAGLSAGVSGGFSAGVSGGFSAGVSGGFSAGISGGASLGGSISGGASISSSSSVSAGVRSRFSGLRFEQPAQTQIDGERLLRSLRASSAATGPGASFLPGGRVVVAPGGLRADVGNKLDLAARLQFEED